MTKKIILTGGGTGGHITPLLAIAHELKQIDPSCHVIYIGERNPKYAALIANNPDFDEVKTIFAGKFRRYHGESWITRIADVKTFFLNLRDLIYFFIGTIQSVALLNKLRPDLLLLKGGFVGVPVGLAAALWRLPFITHDSDIVPGLANRIVSRWAKLHATGMPAEYYPYTPERVRHVGVMVSKDYELVTPDKQSAFKTQLGLPEDSRLLLVTGGSGGAQIINQAVRNIAESLLAGNPKLHIIHQVGIGKGSIYKGYSHSRLQYFELLQPMYVYTGASDVVITRAGANTMAELGVQAKASVVIPNPLLTGGHQLKNAKIWQDKQAAEIIDEEKLKTDGKILEESVVNLLKNEKYRIELGKNLHELTIKDAAHRLALVLLDKQ